MPLTLPRRFAPLAALTLGALAAAGFAPLDLWPVTLLAFAGFLALVREAPSLRSALGRGWLFGVGHFVAGLNWIATAFYYQEAMPHWLGWVAVVLLALYLAVYPALAAGIAWARGRGGRRRFVVIFAAAWMLTEYMRATFFTGFAWNPLGVVWVGGPIEVARSATIIGTYGLSGLTVLAAGAVLSLAEGMLTSALLFACFPLLAFVAGLVGHATAPTGPLLRIVQPNINQDEKYEPEKEAAHFAVLAGLSGKPGPEPRLILWPEAAVPDYLEDEPAARARLARLLGPRDMLMTGGVAIEWGGPAKDKAVGARNSLFLLDAKGDILARYDKAHLVPYGEYLPMRPILSAIGLSRLAPGDLDFQPGPGPRTLAVPGFGAVGLQICYEIIFSGEVVDEAHRPAFLFNPSNDAWFGPTGPPQHLAQARLRAVEEGLPIVRATPTGISAVIDAEGRLLATIPPHRAGAIEMRLPPAHAPTPFARYGNLLPLLFGLLLAACGFARRARPR